MKLTDILTAVKAHVYSASAHSGQVRKFSGDPYIKHPIRVRNRVKQFMRKFGKGDPDILAAALLHDSIEDSHVTHGLLVKHFNKNVAGIVQWLTNLPSGSKNKHIEHLMKKGPYGAVLIKTMDRIDNLSDGGGPSFIGRYEEGSRIILDGLKARGFTDLYNEFKREFEKHYAA